MFGDGKSFRPAEADGGGFRGVFQQGFFFEVRFDMSNGETLVVYRVLL